MACHGGPKASPDGLVLSFDLANKKSFANSTINSTSWSLGSGGATGYNQNGATAENERVTGTDPFGKSSTVWETRPQGNNADDGGWNSDWFNIDNTKLYRFSVWVKRTSTTTGGTFYLGLYGNGDGIKRTDNNSVEGNPYWDCRGTSGFEKDIWYLVVGHCYPYNTSYTGQHPESGIYTVSGGSTKVLSINACNIGADVKWAGANVTQGIHRCYHYYCSDATTRLQLFDPRVDAIDGTEPSVSSLLSGFTASRLRNYNNDSVIGTFANTPTYSSANGGSLVFDGVDDHATSSLSSGLGNQFSVSVWFKKNNNNVANPVNFQGSPSFELLVDQSNQLNIWDGANHFYSFTATIGAWYNMVVVKNSTNFLLYINGSTTPVLDFISSYNNTNTNVVIGKHPTALANYINGNIAAVSIYNRALTAAEIQQNFNATKSRYGL